MKTRAILLLLSCLFFSACKQSINQPKEALPASTGSIKITGAYALYPLTLVWVKEFQKTHPGILIQVEANGSGGGMEDILNDKTNLAMMSNDIPASLEPKLFLTPVARLGVVVIISKKNPYLDKILKQGINRDNLIALFSNKNPKTWGDLYGTSGKDPVKVYDRADSSGAKKILARFLWMQPGAIQGMAVFGEDKMVEAVKKDPLALGYCNFSAAFDLQAKAFYPDFCILPLDINQNGTMDPKESYYDQVDHLQRAMWLGKYPCPLCRDLFYVSSGKPKTPEVTEYLKWVLTEGQKSVASQGYVELHSSDIETILNTLSE